MEYSENVYANIKQQYIEFAEQLNIDDIQFIPLSALEGDNVVNLSSNTPWYTGPALMSLLENIEVQTDD